MPSDRRVKGAGVSPSWVPSIIPGWLTAAGVGGWLLLGIAGALAVAGWFLSTSASISIPLLLAIVIGMVAYPLCEKLMQRGVPRAAAAGIVLTLLFAIVAVAGIVTVKGVVGQWPDIQSQLQNGLDSLETLVAAQGWDTQELMTAIQTQAEAAGGSGLPSGTEALASWLLGFLSRGLSGVVSLVFGIFIATTLLYYVLADFPTVARWIGGHMGGLPPAVGEGIVADAVRAMRGYFRGTTITGLAVAIVIAVAMLLMGIPLAATVALVTFLTCYVPYFGAIISGAFAFLIALGTSGIGSAVALLVVVLIAQNVLQTVINARVMGDSLDLHPLVVLVVTMLGGIYGGLLGAALGAPLAALLVSAGKRLRNEFWPPA